MDERGISWGRLAVAGAGVALALLALNPLIVRIQGNDPATWVAQAVPAECEITGLAEYAIRDVQAGACSTHVYVRACRDAQAGHRERCQEFCGALRDVGGSRVCLGSSQPVAHLFDPELHCREVRHEQFEVECKVTSACSCVATATSASS